MLCTFLFVSRYFIQIDTAGRIEQVGVHIRIQRQDAVLQLSVLHSAAVEVHPGREPDLSKVFPPGIISGLNAFIGLIAEQFIKRLQ